MRRRGLVSQLYRTARLANDVSAVTSGNPHRIARRAKNRIVGRAMARAGLWRLLWGRGAARRVTIEKHSVDQQHCRGDLSAAA
jgi:hypothetical protein